MTRKLTIRRGLKSDLPILDIGELGYAIDTEELFIGSEQGNVLFAKKSELDTLQEEISTIQQSDVFTRLGVSVNGLLTIDGIEQLTGGGSSDMTLVVKDYFEGSTNITKTYTDNMVGFAISNDAGVAGGTLTFTINGITIPVKATESYEANFIPYKSVIINTTVPYRATVSAPYGATFDTIAPLNVTGLTTLNVTTADLTLSWVASASSDTSGYDIYNGSTLLTTVTGTTYNVTGLTPSTSYSFTIKAKDNSGNVSSGVSVTISTLADITPPNNVTNLVASNVLATSLALSWTASTSSDTTGYDIYNGSTLLTTVIGTTYTVSGLTTNTSYTFTVKAKDGFNNIATGSSVSVTTANVDTTAPFDVTGLTAGTPTVNSIPVGWTLSSSSDVANYEVAYSSNSGSTWTVASSLINNNSTSYTITGLVTGTTYTIRVIAIDTSGNRSTGATITKATASSASYIVSASPSSGTYNTTQNVALSVTPTGATIYYTTNGTTPTTSSSVYNSPIAVSVNTTIKFFAQDGNGNATSVQTATYTIDTVAPTVTISPVSGTYNSSKSVTITSNETSTIYYTIDGTTPTVSSSVYSLPINVNSTQTIKYLVVDIAGNQTTGSATYTIDTVSPDPVTSLTVGTVTSNSISVNWTAPLASDVSKYEIAYSSDSGTNYTIATASLGTPATSYTVNGLVAGTPYTIRVVSIDGVGNRSDNATISTTTLMIQDTTPPTITISPAGGTFGSTQTVSLSSNEPSTIYYTLDGTIPTTSSNIYSTPITVSSPTIIKYYGVDSAGNVGSIGQERYTVGTVTDTTAPTLTITPSSASYNTDQTVTAITNESSIIYYELLPNTSSTTAPTTNSPKYTKPITVTSTQKYSFLAIDASGNQSGAKYVTITIDKVPPNPVSNLVASTITNSKMVLSWVATDATIYSIFDSNNALLGTTTGTTFSIIGLNPSTTYTFAVQGTDAAGNNSTLATYTNSTIDSNTYIATGYVSDTSLKLFEENPSNGSTIYNKNNYFPGINQYTLSMTLSSNLDVELLTSWTFGDDSHSKFKMKRNATTGSFAANIYSGSTTKLAASANHTDITSTYHVSIVRDSANMTLYVNDINEGSIAVASSFVINDSLYPLILGNLSKTASFKNVAYYNRALTSTELTQNYNALK